MLLILQHACGRSLTPLEVASQVNVRYSPNPAMSALAVECTLMALALRPELRGRLRLHARRTSPIEQRRRARLGIPVLAASAIVAACSVQPIHPTQYPRGYFGSPVPVARQAPKLQDTDLALVRPPAVVWTPSPEPDPWTHSVAAVSLKSTPKLTPWSPPAYFDDNLVDLERLVIPRLEADLVPSFSHPESVATPVVRQLSDKAPPLRLQTLAISSDLRRNQSPLLSLKLPSLAEPAALPQNAIQFRGVAELPPQDHAGDYWIGFRNGSQHVRPDERSALAALAALLPPDGTIKLRGRVGARALRADHMQLAIGRALATKAQLVAAGIPASSIRIMYPKPNDLLDSSKVDASANMSVSIYLDDSSRQQVARKRPAIPS